MSESIWLKVLKQRYLFLMLLPTIVLVTIFAYKPILGWVIAFTDYRIGESIWSGEWAGFGQFKEFFVDSSDAAHVFTNTIVINISCLVVNLFCALIFAILLNEIRSKFAKSMVQTVTLFPFFISWVIAYSLIYSFVSVNSGLLNMFLFKMGIVSEGINILGDPQYSWQLMVFANLWKALGYNTIIFLAAIAGIGQQQYEAAEIDGAKRFRKIWHITIPGMIPTLTVLLILNSGWLLNSNFDQFYLFTNPTNRPRMEVFDMYVYRYGLKLARFSYATSVSIVKTFVSIMLLVLVNIVCKKTSGKSIF